MKKIAILGSGTIGSTLAYTLFMKCRDIEISMINRNEMKAWAKTFDISHISPDILNNSIKSEKIDESYNVDIIVLTVGTLPGENGKRTDVLKENIEIFKTLLPSIIKNNPQALIINVVNPVDAMTYAIQKITGISPKKLMGTGTELDSMRMKNFLAKEYHINENQLQFNIIGEHGDSMVPVWSTAKYRGKKLEDQIGRIPEDKKRKYLRKTLEAGWDIRKAGEHSCYAISFSTAKIIESILGTGNKDVSISSLVNGEQGISKAYLSIPTKLNLDGIGERSRLVLDEEEKEKLIISAKIIQQQMETVDSFF